MTLMYLLLGLALLLVILTIYLAILSRHKKSASGSVNLMGATGMVQQGLDPEGAVIIDGELWRARAMNRAWLSASEQIRVVGLDGHLLLVEPVVKQNF